MPKPPIESAFSDPSLVLYLPLYELDGGVFRSKDAQGHPCSVSGALYQGNRDGRYFDGSDDVLNASADAPLNLLNNFTISIWVKRNRDSTNEVFIGKTNGAGTENVGYKIDFSAGDTVDFTKPGVVALATVATITDKNWHHIASVQDSTVGMAIYLEGTVNNTNTNKSNANSDVNYLAVGCHNKNGTPATFFQGNIAEVAVYNRVLSAPEIARIYNMTNWRYT